MNNERAAYRILAANGFFGPDDHLYIVDASGNYPEIYYDGEPNDEMEPLNDLARSRMLAYLEKQDNFGRQAAEKAGKAYVGRPRDLDGAIQLATAVAREDMRIQGVQKAQQVSTIETIAKEDVPETGQTNAKRGRGRPKGSLLIRDQEVA